MPISLKQGDVSRLHYFSSRYLNRRKANQGHT